MATGAHAAVAAREREQNIKKTKPARAQAARPPRPLRMAQSRALREACKIMRVTHACKIMRAKSCG